MQQITFNRSQCLLSQTHKNYTNSTLPVLYQRNDKAWVTAHLFTVLLNILSSLFETYCSEKKKKSPKGPVSDPSLLWENIFHSPLSALPRNHLSNLGLATGRPHFIMLHFIVLCKYCVLCKLKLCGNTASNKSIATVFITVFSHFTFLCHIW